jgi:hypothetical protein
MSTSKLKKDVYENVIKKLIIKVKNHYLKYKAKEKEVDLKKLLIDEEDWQMVPNSLWDEIVTQMRHKYDENKKTIESFIAKCEEKIQEALTK